MNDSPKNDTVVSFAAMRKELLSKNRLSPTVAARARLSEILSKAGPADKVLIPFFQAATMYCYLDHNRDISNWREARNDLKAAMDWTIGEGLINDAPMPLFCEIKQATFETFALLPFNEITDSMQGKFTAELERLGYEYL